MSVILYEKMFDVAMTSFENYDQCPGNETIDKIVSL